MVLYNKLIHWYVWFLSLLTISKDKDILLNSISTILSSCIKNIKISTCNIKGLANSYTSEKMNNIEISII